MEYSYLDLLCYILIYSFLGWVTEVVVIAVKEQKFRNRGFFNVPFCLSYGIVMGALILIIPTLEGNYLMAYIASLVISAVVTFLSGSLAKRISRTSIWNYQANNLFSGTKKAFLFGLLQGLVFLLAVLLIHPLLYILISLIPYIVKLIFCIIIAVILIYDFVVILVALRKKLPQEDLDAIIAKQQTGKRTIGQKITDGVLRRLYKAYPAMEKLDSPEKSVFAKGICFDKLIWVFLIMAVLGDLIETVYVWATTGILMSRSSLIYGPFSIIWGFAAILLTVVLEKVAEKNDRWVFIAGFFIGGIYEYTCSVVSEIVFGTVFWDYSDMMFNIGGRTNLLFCFFWGILSVIWVKIAYPFFSRLIEKIPLLAGKIITWFIITFFALDCILSAAALLRYVDRIEDPDPDNVIEEFLDNAYPDSMLDVIWPNLRLTE